MAEADETRPSPTPLLPREAREAREAEAADPIFEALWRRVDDAWDDDKTHAAALDYAMQSMRLPELAGRYRALRDDDARGELAKKKLGAIVLAAEGMLLAATRSDRPRRVAWPVTAAIGLVCALVLFWMAQAVLRR